MMCNVISGRFGVITGLLALMIVAAVPAKAETIMPGVTFDLESKMGSFVTSQAYGTAIAQQAAAYEGGLGFTCDQGYTVSLRNLRIIRPVVTVAEGPLFASEGIAQPTGGVWSNRHLITRCGESFTYNSLAGIADNGQLSIRHLVPGTTGLHPLLINRFKPLVARLAEIPECKTVIISNTVAGAPEGVKLSKEDGTYETWTINGCEQVVRLVIRFDANEKKNGLLPTVEDRRMMN
jgi:hypothetical protein